MATDNPADDDRFRTASELLDPTADVRDGAESIQFCLECSEIAGRQIWSGHEMQDDGSYECLSCLDRHVPDADQATPEDVAEAYADLGEGPDK